jgi:class 3 adenylate cyclase
MAEPQIRYARSADGTRIAYVFSEEGREPPLLFVNYMFLAIGAARIGMHGSAPTLAAGRQYVRLDRRGIGYSQRDVTDFSLDAQVADILAVAVHAGLSRFDLMGFGDGCLVAAAFAARHPEFVRKMALSGPSSAGGNPSFRSVATMARSNWSLARGTIADIVLGGDADPEGRRAYIRLLAEILTSETAASYLETAWDPGLELGSIAAPTLVIYPKRRLAGPIETSQMMAADIPGARFLAPDASDLDRAYHEAVREFFGDEDVGDADKLTMIRPQASPPSGTAIILFADIVDSTALTERMGDAAFRAKARDLDASLRSIITEAGGTTIDAKTLGDGVLATFPAASQAIDAALRCGAAGNAQGLPLHLGLHAGDVIREQNNVFGGAVNIASRISALSAPGEVLVSDTVRSLARTSAGVTFEDRGEHMLKGVADAQRVYAVRKDGA